MATSKAVNMPPELQQPPVLPMGAEPPPSYTPVDPNLGYQPQAGTSQQPMIPPQQLAPDFQKPPPQQYVAGYQQTAPQQQVPGFPQPAYPQYAVGPQPVPQQYAPGQNYAGGPQHTVYTTNQYQTAVSPPVTTVVTQTTVQNRRQSSMRSAIPALPMALAIILCIVNIIAPGLGTVIAGFSVLCCGNVGQSTSGRVGTFCINFWVGLLQGSLIFVFLIGWIWSIIWGVFFITISAEEQKKNVTTTTTATSQIQQVYVQSAPA